MVSLSSCRVLSASIVLFFGTAADADFVPVSRHTQITGEVSRPGSPTTHNVSTLDTFEPYSGSFPDLGVFQNSSITASTVSVSMAASGGVFMPGNIGVTTSSTFTFVFNLQVPGSFTLTGDWGANTSLVLRLSGPSGVFDAPAGLFDLSGDLLPGIYTFEASVGPAQAGGGSLNALLTVVPTPGAAMLPALAAISLTRRRR